MTAGACAPLERALQLSRLLLTAADAGSGAAIAELDAERLQLLMSFREQNPHLSAADQSLLVEISQLNDRALGAMEHHRRIKERELDLASRGRRAVHAYAAA